LAPPAPPLFPSTTLFRSAGPASASRLPPRSSGGTAAPSASTGGRPAAPASPASFSGPSRGASDVTDAARRVLVVDDDPDARAARSEEHTSELQSRENLVC